MAFSALATPTATKRVLEEFGLATKKRLGQHFLIDDNVIGRILDLAEVSADENVLEVGPGIGTLTVALCAVAGSVVAVERDPDLLPVLTRTAADFSALTVIRADATTVSARELSEPHGAPAALVANLPYGVAATVVLRCFEELPLMNRAIVMVQAEVADRMCAEPGCKEYGSYTVKLRLRAAPVGRFAVSRGCFLPPPRVDSAVVRFDRVSPAASGAFSEDEILYAGRVADAGFAQRRKTIRNSLGATLGVPTAQLDEALASAGIDGGIRAERLSPKDFVRLGKALRQVAGKHSTSA